MALGQENLKPDKKNTPIYLYPKKQERLRKKLGVTKSIVLFKNSKGKLDTSRIEIFNEEGQVYRVENKTIIGISSSRKGKKWSCFQYFYDKRTGERTGIQYCNGEKMLSVNNGNYSKYIKGEYIVFASNDSIIWRIRNQFFESDLLYIHESIHEENQMSSFRNIMRLDANFNILSMTVFDTEPERENKSQEKFYSVQHFYNKKGERIKTLRYEHDKLHPKATHYEYYKNGLIKREIHESYSFDFNYVFL